MEWVWAVLLFLVLLLQRAWDHLYDRQFTWRGLFLLAALFGLWIAVLVAQGWRGALLAVLFSFAVGAVLDALLPRYLGRLLRRRAEHWSAKERARFARLLDESSSAGFYERMEEEHLEGAQRCQMTLLMASIDKDVEKALAGHGKHTEDLATFYFDKQVKDLPPWHRERAVRNPRAIDYYFATALDLPASRPSRVLRAWIMERPAGAMPSHLEAERQAEETLAAKRRAARA